MQTAAAVAAIAAAILAGAGFAYQVVSRRPKLHIRWKPLIVADMLNADEWVGARAVLENVGDSGTPQIHAALLIRGIPADDLLAGPVDFDDQPSADATYPSIPPGGNVDVRFRLNASAVESSPGVMGLPNVELPSHLSIRVKVGRFKTIESGRPDDIDEGLF
jgi:hypothetical protein